MKTSQCRSPTAAGAQSVRFDTEPFLSAAVKFLAVHRHKTYMALISPGLGRQAMPQLLSLLNDNVVDGNQAGRDYTKPCIVLKEATSSIPLLNMYGDCFP